MTSELVTVSMFFIVMEGFITEVRFSDETEFGLFSCLLLLLGFSFVLLFAFIMNPYGNIK